MSLPPEFRVTDADGTLRIEWDRVTVFRYRGDEERFGWSVSDGGETQYSPHRGYETAADAVDALWDALGEDDQ